MADGQLQWKGGPDNLHPYYFALFDADEEVEITVTSTNDLSRTRILPTRRGIRPEVCAAHRVVFRARSPFKLSFEPQVRHRALVLSANLPERDAPEKGDNLACIRTQRTHDRWQQHKVPGDIRRLLVDGVSFPNGLPPDSESIWLENIDDSRTVDGIRFVNLEQKPSVTVKGKVTNWDVRIR